MSWRSCAVLVACPLASPRVNTKRENAFRMAACYHAVSPSRQSKLHLNKIASHALDDGRAQQRLQQWRLRIRVPFVAPESFGVFHARARSVFARPGFHGLQIVVHPVVLEQPFPLAGM